MAKATGTALLVIDLQRQFTDPDGAVAIEDGAGLVARVNAVVASARSVGVPILWVEQRRREGLPLARTSSRFGVDDLHRGRGAELDPALAASEEDQRLVKRQQSAFAGTDLDLALRGLGVRRLVLAGVTTNVCVLATAKDAAERDLEVITLAEATASRAIQRGDHQLTAAEVQRSALAFINYAYGEVRSTDRLPWA